MREVVFWEKRYLSLYTINGLFMCAFGSWFGLTFLPLRLLTVCGLWLVVLYQHEFTKNLLQVLLKRLKDLDVDQLLKETNLRIKQAKHIVSGWLHWAINVLTGIYEVFGPPLRKVIDIVVYICEVADLMLIQRHRVRVHEGASSEKFLNSDTKVSILSDKENLSSRGERGPKSPTMQVKGHLGVESALVSELQYEEV